MLKIKPESEHMYVSWSVNTFNLGKAIHSSSVALGTYVEQGH